MSDKEININGESDYVKPLLKKKKNQLQLDLIRLLFVHVHWEKHNTFVP